MENISQEEVKIEDVDAAIKNVEAVADTVDAASDIQFDEIFDIEQIQKKLLESIEKGDLDVPPEEASLSITPSDLPVQISPSSEGRRSRSKGDADSKKYVIYINSDNIDFMESLSQDERKNIINRVLKNQNQLSIEKKKRDEKVEYTAHVILACITFIVVFPIMFIGVNKALEATISNYQQAKSNFSKLYREQGKIKYQESSAIPGG